MFFLSNFDVRNALDSFEFFHHLLLVFLALSLSLLHCLIFLLTFFMSYSFFLSVVLHSSMTSFISTFLSHHDSLLPHRGSAACLSLVLLLHSCHIAALLQSVAPAAVAAAVTMTLSSRTFTISFLILAATMSLTGP